MPCAPERRCKGHRLLYVRNPQTRRAIASGVSGTGAGAPVPFDYFAVMIEVPAPILLPAGLVLFGADRRFLSLADDLDRSP